MNFDIDEKRITRMKDRLESTTPRETPGVWCHEDVPSLLDELHEVNLYWETRHGNVLHDRNLWKARADALTAEIEQKNKGVGAVQGSI